MRETETETKAWMQKRLHDMAQPLTALECRLYLATMAPAPGKEPTVDEMRSAIEDGLVECARLMAEVRAMQDRLAA